MTGNAGVVMDKTEGSENLFTENLSEFRRLQGPCEWFQTRETNLSRVIRTWLNVARNQDSTLQEQ